MKRQFMALTIRVSLCYSLTFANAYATLVEEFNEVGIEHRMVDAQALNAIRTQARNGNAETQYKLGHMYDLGMGVKQDFTEAVKWYRLSAAQGNSQAQYHLGDLIERGKDAATDSSEAVIWYRRAAEQGVTEAQCILGFRLEQESPPNYKEAVSWFILAAKAKRDPLVLNELAFLYKEGKGVTQNFKEAVRIYRLSAEQGDSIAQYELAHLYANGQGAARNIIRAYMWSNIAAAESAHRHCVSQEIFIPQ